jgi:hypothetical protein
LAQGDGFFFCSFAGSRLATKGLLCTLQVPRERTSLLGRDGGAAGRRRSFPRVCVVSAGAAAAKQLLRFLRSAQRVVALGLESLYAGVP